MYRRRRMVSMALDRHDCLSTLWGNWGVTTQAFSVDRRHGRRRQEKLPADAAVISELSPKITIRRNLSHPRRQLNNEDGIQKVTFHLFNRLCDGMIILTSR